MRRLKILLATLMLMGGAWQRAAAIVLILTGGSWFAIGLDDRNK